MWDSRVWIFEEMRGVKFVTFSRLKNGARASRRRRWREWEIVPLVERLTSRPRVWRGSLLRVWGFEEEEG